jgi:hypothetical protein
LRLKGTLPLLFLILPLSLFVFGCFCLFGYVHTSQTFLHMWYFRYTIMYCFKCAAFFLSLCVLFLYLKITCNFLFLNAFYAMSVPLYVHFSSPCAFLRVLLLSAHLFLSLFMQLVRAVVFARLLSKQLISE